MQFAPTINKANIHVYEIDDSAFAKNGENFEKYGNYMELEMIKKYPIDFLTLDDMHSLGLKGNIQTIRKLPENFNNIL